MGFSGKRFLKLVKGEKNSSQLEPSTRDCVKTVWHLFIGDQTTLTLTAKVKDRHWQTYPKLLSIQIHLWILFLQNILNPGWRNLGLRKWASGLTLVGILSPLMLESKMRAKSAQSQ